MLPVIKQFRKEAEALGRDSNSIKELRMWAVSKIAGGFDLGSTVITIHDKQSGQVIGVVRTDNKEKALSILAEYLEPEDPGEALDWLQEHTKLEFYQLLDPK